MPRERKSSLKLKNNNSNADGNDNDNPPKTNKKRRTSNAATAAAQATQNINSNATNNGNNSNSTNQASELIPPQPLSSYGETIIASNPFDDTPSQNQSQTHPPNALTPSGGPPPSVGSMPPTPGTPLPTMTQNQPQPKPVPLMSGKIYPPEQSMVFNPANPNAPPIYPCGICHKEVHDNDQAILCESGCNFWFHRICTGITERAYCLLTKEVYAEWVCDKCLQSKQIPLVKFKP